MELGQDLLRTTAGEAFTPAEREVDLDGAEEAFRRADRAREGARRRPDPGGGAARSRRRPARAGFVRGSSSRSQLGAHIPIAQRVAAGEVLEDMLPELPIAPLVYEAAALFEEALELFERLGDRRGAMASIIAMGYLSWAPDIHLGSGSARHIEEIRRLTSKAKAFTNESERAAFEAQMLYGVHVFARAKVDPRPRPLAGRAGATRTRARSGDRSLEFLAAGGTAMAHLDLGEVEQARPWIDRAAAIASEHPTPLRARRLETWRGLARVAAGDAAGMRQHLERAVQLATDIGAAGRAMRGAGAPRRGGVAPRSRARGRRSARRRRARGRRSCGSSRPRSRAIRRGERRRRPPSRGSRSRGAGPRKPPITRARRWSRCSPRCTRTCTWTSCCRPRTPSMATGAPEWEAMRSAPAD